MMHVLSVVLLAQIQRRIGRKGFPTGLHDVDELHFAPMVAVGGGFGIELCGAERVGFRRVGMIVGEEGGGQHVAEHHLGGGQTRGGSRLEVCLGLLDVARNYFAAQV